MVTRRIVVNGRTVEVVLDKEGGFQLDGRTGTVSIVQAEPGVYSVLLNGRSYEVYANADSYLINGVAVSAVVDDPRIRKKQTGAVSIEGRQTIAAAMPGKVVRVLVREGDAVEAGQGVAVIEAMKMQNEAKSPKAGRVVTVAIAEGMAVSAGTVLAVVE